MILSYDPDVDIKVWVIFDNMLSVPQLWDPREGSLDVSSSAF